MLVETEARHAKGINPSGCYGLFEMAPLAFQSKTNRQQDVELADAEGFTLSRKILVRNMPSISTAYLVEIGGMLYEIAYIDRAGILAYLYLDSIEVDGRVDLVKTTTEKTPLGVPEVKEITTVAWCRKRSWKRERATSAGSDRLSMSATITVRAEDWDEQRIIRIAEKQYSVIGAASKGRWVEIEAERKAGDK
ncbi:MAG: hypothetical protein RR772_07180 [Gordonibacter sp.]